MDQPVRITFHGIEASVAVEDHIRRRATKLERLYHRLLECHVILERPHAHKHHGGHYRVRIDLAMPRAALVVSRAPDLDSSLADLYAAIDAAFHDAARVLQAHVQRLRGDVKSHTAALLADGPATRVSARAR